MILCNGERPSETLIRSVFTDRDGSTLLIAADGGANIAKECDILPDVVIGDMDSWSDGAFAGADVIHDPDQETNDLEKALALARLRGVRRVTILAGLGARIDHSLKNLSVLRRFHDAFDSLRMLDEHSHVEVVRSPFHRELAPGTTVSLFPLSGAVREVRTCGLLYEWSGEDLENGVKDGTSNQMVGKELMIEFSSGDLLLILPGAGGSGRDAGGADVL